ncbi:zinc ribbon domain-containing protein [Streptomyces sp. NPDC051907]|uniref:NADase-type glycan-binding domain-containing protein n=1 Tax=Streptomyces sp. NPDC051907 TaxID=3155284 RepID=UPI003429F4EA
MTRQTPRTVSGREGATNCAECGTRAEPSQSFCDSCGAVLGWTSEGPERTEAAAAAPATREAADAAAEPGAGGSGRVASPGEGRTGGDEQAGAAPETSGPTAAGDGPGSAGGAAQAPDASAEDTLPARPEPSAAPDDTAARARSLLVPVGDPEPRPAARPSVAPVLPGRPDADRPQVRAPGQETGGDGGVPCTWCSTSNRPDRHFCGRCAMPMSAAPGSADPRRRPWWRRLLDFRNRPTPWAGDRPRVRRGFGRVMNVVVGVLVLAALITAGLHTGVAYDAVRDHFAKRAPIAPDTVKASQSYPDHEPKLAFDKLNNTWWGPGVPQSGAGQWIEARFDRPTRLLDLVVTPGVSARPDQLSESALPHRLDAVITKADGKTFTRSLTLDQGAGGQRHAFRVGEVTAVRFVLRSAYGAAEDKQVAVAEIEFFGPSNSGRND